MDVPGKVVIITGASAGIGLATARVFAQYGAKVALAARSADVLKKTVDELRGQGHQAFAVLTDMGNKADVDHMVEEVFKKYGQIDILVNNAGQSVVAPILELKVEDYQKIIELNLYGVLWAMQAVVPKMRLNGGGIILNVTSTVSRMAIPGIGGYASTKYALNGLSMTARAELASENIRVILVYPGRTSTDFGKNAIIGADPATALRRSGAGGPEPDTAEWVAQKILEAAQNEPAEQNMH